MESIKEILMRRDGMDYQKAISLIRDAKKQLQEYLLEDGYVDDAEFMAEWFGLEPDYIWELI